MTGPIYILLHTQGPTTVLYTVCHALLTYAIHTIANTYTRWVKLYSCSCTLCQRSLYFLTDIEVAGNGSQTIFRTHETSRGRVCGIPIVLFCMSVGFTFTLQKGGVPAAPSGTATLLRLSPNHRFRPRPILAATDFRRPRLSWLDGRCVQGPGTYSPRHG